MNAVPDYPYASGNLLEDRNNYFYTGYLGEPFLKSWLAQRGNVYDNSHGYTPNPLPIVTSSDALIAEIRDGLAPSSPVEGKSNSLSRLDHLLRSYEVTKRIYEAYQSDWKPVDKTAYHNIVSYIHFAYSIICAYEVTGIITYLNALLKCTDTLTSLNSHLTPGSLAHLSKILTKEKSLIGSLRDDLEFKCKKRATPSIVMGITQKSPRRGITRLEGVTMIACASARSQAYIQILIGQGMCPESVIFLGTDANPSNKCASSYREWNGLMLPHLGEPVTETCRNNGIDVYYTPDRDVNSDATAELINATNARYLIYSGVSGQIVSDRILRIGPRFLHLHSGWLPDYRGSTTIYYSLLNGRLPGVSAIFLDSGIDTGPIIQRQSYPLPPSFIDVDLVYDPAIRADLLCRIMSKYCETKCIEATGKQSSYEGRFYYVIHPVLKHIALLSLEKMSHD